MRVSMEYYDNEGEADRQAGPGRAWTRSSSRSARRGRAPGRAVRRRPPSGSGSRSSRSALTVIGRRDLARRRSRTSPRRWPTVARTPSFYVERGYQADCETLIIQLVLAGLGAVLMLGGTLTATFLALSDARPDLATLSAVGASPRTRRGVAAAYAVVVGLVGRPARRRGRVHPGHRGDLPAHRHGRRLLRRRGVGPCSASGAQTGPFLDVPVADDPRRRRGPARSSPP